MACHDVVLALGIHVGSGFVKQVDGRIMQQGAGHGKALALAAGKIAAALMQGGLQAVLAAAEVGQIHLFQCGPKLVPRSASGFAMRRLLSTVPLKMAALWGTSVRVRRRCSRCSSCTGTPPSVTLPV